MKLGIGLMIAGGIALGGCDWGTCGRLKQEFKQVSLEGYNLSKSGEMFSQPDKIMDLSRRTEKIQSEAIQAECKLSDITSQ